ncbi:MAG: MarR family winged helix-turn-helix transcriptional regulator [Candidatus Dormibacteraeota bacterium]|nr:MarR family winged helix-turn-helix transcriptional regulator [Candidatus Dormibacteraeota bacterium]
MTIGPAGRGPGPAARGDDDSLLALSLAALGRVLAQHWRQGPGSCFARKDLSFGQMHVLMLLHERGALTVGQLAETLGVSMPSVSSQLDRLEEHQLVERRRDESDRRLVHIVLTDAGARDAEAAAGFRRELAEQLLAGFDQDELRALLTVLAAVERCIGADTQQSS